MQLHRRQQELTSAGLAVALVSFESGGWAQRWLKETRVTFPLLIDTNKTVYTQYGLQHSFWRAWNLRTLLFYARKILSGERLIVTGGDLNQLGGDFILSADMNIRFSYYSHDPTDRPAVQLLLDSVL